MRKLGLPGSSSSEPIVYKKTSRNRSIFAVVLCIDVTILEYELIVPCGDGFPAPSPTRNLLLRILVLNTVGNAIWAHNWKV